MRGCFVPVFELLEQLLVAAAIEAPLALLLKPVEAIRREALEPTRIPLGFVPEGLNAVDVIPAFRLKGLAVVYTPAVELGDIKCVVSGKAIGVHNTIDPNPLTDDRHERLEFGIEDDGGKHFPTTL